MQILERLAPGNPLHNRRLRRKLRQLVKIKGFLPLNVVLARVSLVGTDAVGGGGYADVWRGSWGCRDVALKVMRVFGNEEMIRESKFVSGIPATPDLQALPKLDVGVCLGGIDVVDTAPRECVALFRYFRERERPHCFGFTLDEKWQLVCIPEE